MCFSALTHTETIGLPYTIIPSESIRAGGPCGRSTSSRSADLQPLSFSSFFRVDNPQDYPQCTHVKIVGDGSAGSGTLIDPYHVLTAAHVVHEGPGGGTSRME